MSPREIEVHIEELVLHGFAPGSRWEVGEALESELQALLAARGVPPAWFANPARIDGGALAGLRPASPPAAGRAVARAIHEGGTP